MAKRYSPYEEIVIDGAEATDEVVIDAGVPEYRPQIVFLVSRNTDTPIVQREDGDRLISRKWA